MKRLILAVMCLSFAGSHVEAQTPPANPTSTISVIKSVAEMIGAIGDALGKLTDGVQKMVEAGDKGWSTVQARRTHQSLIELSSLTTDLVVSQRAGPLPTLESYLTDPTPENWKIAGERIGRILVAVDTLLDRLNRERSELVLQPVYAKLSTALHGRQALLAPLQSAPPPRTAAELRELRRLVAQYRIMIAQLESARDELNAYAREGEGRPGAG